MLLLFDIDGTLLLDAAEAHAAAMHAALRSVFGLADPAAARIHPAGRTDGDIARAILLQLGVPAETVDARADDLRVACCEEYARRVPEDLSAHVAPGMRESLEELAAHEEKRLSLVTGNFEPIARLKLRAAGLEGFFPPGQGGFGSDDEDRTRLPEVARRRAGSTGGQAYPRERTVVIGDTPRDIACARADGVRCVAVSTGLYGAAELADADAVARSGHELVDVLGRLTG